LKTAEVEIEKKNAAFWTREEVFNSGKETLSTLLRLISEAQSKIDFEVYIFHRDFCGDQFAQELKKAALRGVKVRLLVDGIGAFGFSGWYIDELRQAGVSVRIYHSTPFDEGRSRFFWWIPWKGYGKLLGKINKRNHRKTLIVDDRTVVVGSINVTSDHLPKSDGGQGWRDTGVLIEGPAVSSFIVAFDRAWEYFDRISFTPAPAIPLIPVMFNFSSKLRRLRYLLLLELLYSSEQRVWITNAYFVPDGSLLKALRFAAWTGVDVKILVPLQSDVFIIRMVSSAFYLGLLAAGVRIFEYSPSMLHAKTLLIDDLGIVGTSNLNHRSLLHDLEVDVILKKESSVKSLTNAFEADLKNSKEVTIKDWESRPWLERFMGNLLLYLRYWL